LNTDEDVPFRDGYALTTIVSKEAYMKLEPIPNTDIRTRNSQYPSPNCMTNARAPRGRFELPW
jgi:hypothetical protein